MTAPPNSLRVVASLVLLGARCSGVLTFSVRGGAISANVQGRLGESNGRLTLVLGPVTANGGSNAMGAAGTPVELLRQPARGPGALHL